jgi:ABC-type transport system involved in multi-copper enzyme maturation permease subunit
MNNQQLKTNNKENAMTKIVGIAWYEMLMGWRRRGLAVVVFAFTIALILLLYGVQHLEGAPRSVATDFMNAMSYGLFPSLWQLLAGIPLIAAETFSYDHRTQTKELLGGLPVSEAAYLTGKILGVCTLLLMYFAISAIIVGVVGWLLYGAYDVKAYLLLWLDTLVPMTLFAAALGVMVAVGCTTRRQGIIAGMICIPYAVIISIYGLVTGGFAPAIVMQTVFFLLMNTAVIWGLAWFWLRQHEGV